MRIIGIILIVIGSLSRVWRDYVYPAGEGAGHRPLQASTERQKTIRCRRSLGGLALVGGVALMIAGSRKR